MTRMTGVPSTILERSVWPCLHARDWSASSTSLLIANHRLQQVSNSGAFSAALLFTDGASKLVPGCWPSGSVAEPPSTGNAWWHCNSE